MTVYILCADEGTGGNHWLCGAFSSRELAEREKRKRIDADIASTGDKEEQVDIYRIDEYTLDTPPE